MDSSNSNESFKLTRRGFLGAAAGAAAATAMTGPAALAAQGAAGGPRGGPQRDLALINGKIHTFDEHDTVVDRVLIRDGRVAAVGSTGGGPAQVINLKGRTVIPGIIGNHEHFIRIGQAVGYDMRRLEAAFSIEAVQQIIAGYAEIVPEGEFLTALRGLHRRQWSDPPRHPTRQELDDAAPGHPVIISHGSAGQTNTLGRDRLRDLGVTVSDAGSVNDDQAYAALSQFLTLETRKRELLRAAEYCLSVGLTTAQDQHGSTGGAGFLHRVSGHDHYLELVRQKALDVRTRCFFPEQSDTAELQQIVDRLWREFGSDMHQITGIGEWAPRGSNYQTSLRIMAERNLIYHQHLISTTEIQNHLDALNTFVAANPDLPTPAEMRWRLAHLHSAITESQVLEANALGVGLLPHGGSRYLSGDVGGPDFRMIVDLATVPVGTSMDGARVAPINPWPGIYYMVTGRNSAGVLTNDGAQLTRDEAVRLYSGPQQGWFTREEDRLGGIGAGRYADLVVLAADVFDPVAVPDEALRTMTSVMTVVDGRIVYDAGVLDAA